MTMDNFAFMIHPVHAKTDVARKFRPLGYLPESWIDLFSGYFPAVYISRITGVRSRTGKEIEGWFVSCPLTTARFIKSSPEFCYRKIVETGRLAEKLGARVLGLGGFTAVVGDAGVTVAENLNIPVTTGNSYTVAAAVEATKSAMDVMGIDPKRGVVAIVGAAGSIGRVCARLLAREARDIILVGRSLSKLEKVAPSIRGMGNARVQISTEMETIREADAIITVTSAVGTVIDSRHLKPGAVVCDVARPRDVSPRVAMERDDVLVIDGGMIEVPGPDLDFGFDFGFPPRMAYACMVETMILALEGRYESYSLGKDIEIERVEEMAELVRKHGFTLGGFRSFERAVTDSEIEGIKERAAKARLRSRDLGLEEITA
jgi:fatty aldehyde-generating acyl-ACP reductase